MRRIFKKIAKNSLELVGRLKVGDTVLEIAVDNNLIVGLVNGYRVVDGQLADDPMERLVTTLANVAAKLIRDSWGDDESPASIEIRKSEWDSAGKYPSERYMKCMVATLGDALGEGAVKVVGDKKPEMPVVAPKPQAQIQLDLRNLLANMDSYNAKAIESLKCAERVLERASVLVSRKVSSTMWGANKLQERLDAVAKALPLLEKAFEDASRSTSIGLKASSGISARIRKGLTNDADSLKYTKMLLIPDFMSSQEKLLGFVGGVVSALSTLSNLDRIVRNTTGYPASFMFKMSILDDLNEAYTVLVAFLSDIPSMERNIFEPLEYIQHGSFSK